MNGFLGSIFNGLCCDREPLCPEELLTACQRGELTLPTKGGVDRNASKTKLQTNIPDDH